MLRLISTARSVATAPAAADPCRMPIGNWTIDATRSTLQVGVRVGLMTVRGRFTQVDGELEIVEETADSSISVTVQTSSLTSGSRSMDSMLLGAGVIDTEANPVIAFASRAIRADHDSGSCAIDGLLATDGGVLDISLTSGAPELLPDGSMLFRAAGSLPSRDSVRLLSRTGVERLLGRTMELDLTIVAVPA